jgi:hypothetical protein
MPDERPATAPDRSQGLNDPRAIEILTAEHWSLLSSRSIGYTEMFGRATIFVAIMSGTVVALALLAQATDFGPETIAFALALISVALFIGIATFARAVAVNADDARWSAGMTLLRTAYLEIIPELEPYFVTRHSRRPPPDSLAHGYRQRLGNLTTSLTTTSSVVAALNSLLAGALAAGLGSLLGLSPVAAVVLGAAVSIASGVAHLKYAARFREEDPPPES